MESNYDQQQTTAAATTTWVPYEPAKDCSLAVCNSFCPQWCNGMITPQSPPAFLLSAGAADGPSAHTFSLLAVAVIGLLASAFVLLSYYTIVCKYCGTFISPPWRLRWRRGPGRDDGAGLPLDDEAWHDSSSSNGLDEASIDKIPVLKYTRPRHGTAADCAVCLSEFTEDESLRVLPKCSHAFHVRCIDVWLRSHRSCPLCRADLVGENSPPSPGPEPQEAVVSAAENPAIDGAHQSGAATAIEVVDDEDFHSLRRSLSMDFCRVISSSRWAAPEQSGARRLSAMKRSFSSGRVSLTWHGKGRNAVLPI